MPGKRGRAAALTSWIEQAVALDDASSPEQHVHKAALQGLTAAAVSNIPGVDFASISLRHKDRTLETIAATDPLAEQVDALQYELREGPCYAAVTDDRLVFVNDVAASSDFPRYGARAAGLGVGSQLAIQLLHDGEQAGLNLYAHAANAFDRGTAQLAELFATQAAAVFRYAQQVEQLSEALHTRTDIGTAIGILMERYGLDRNQAFAFLVRNSQDRNVKIRVLAQRVIDGSFDPAPEGDVARTTAVMSDSGRPEAPPRV